MENAKGREIVRLKVIVSFILTFIIFNVSAIAAPPKPIITADTTYYDVNTGLYILKGNIYIEVKSRIITAGQAKVSLSTLEIWGSDGITLTEGDVHLSADSVHVFGFRNSSLIEGHVVFKRTGLVITSDRAEFNWKTKIGTFSGTVKVIQGENVWTGSLATYNVESNELEYQF